jgi:hypothetical protein
MKGLFLVTAAIVVSGLTLPAGAAPPAKREPGQLQRQIAVFKAKVRRLKAENKRFRAQNRRLLQLNASRQLRENELVRRVNELDPCPVTLANRYPLPPGANRDTFFGADDAYGNGALWVGVWPSGVVVWKPKLDGSIGMKFPWWREATGRLRIEGRRTDGSGRPLSASVPDAYGERGFQPTGIHFPTQGCWEVTGRVGDASLTFVTFVLAE